MCDTSVASNKLLVLLLETGAELRDTSVASNKLLVLLLETGAELRDTSVASNKSLVSLSQLTGPVLFCTQRVWTG